MASSVAVPIHCCPGAHLAPFRRLYGEAGRGAARPPATVRHAEAYSGLVMSPDATAAPLLDCCTVGFDDQIVEMLGGPREAHFENAFTCMRDFELEIDPAEHVRVLFDCACVSRRQLDDPPAKHTTRAPPPPPQKQRDDPHS